MNRQTWYAIQKINIATWLHAMIVQVLLFGNTFAKLTVIDGWKQDKYDFHRRFFTSENIQEFPLFSLTDSNCGTYNKYMYFKTLSDI